MIVYYKFLKILQRLWVQFGYIIFGLRYVDENGNIHTIERASTKNSGFGGHINL